MKKEDRVKDRSRGEGTVQDIWVHEGRTLVRVRWDLKGPYQDWSTVRDIDDLESLQTPVKTWTEKDLVHAQQWHAATGEGPVPNSLAIIAQAYADERARLVTELRELAKESDEWLTWAADRIEENHKP